MVEHTAIRVLTVLIKITLAVLVVGLLLAVIFFLTGSGSGGMSGLAMIAGGLGSVMIIYGLIALVVLWLARFFVRRGAK